MVLLDQVITSLYDIQKKYGIKLSAPKTNKKNPAYFYIKENLDETEKIIASVRHQIDEKIGKMQLWKDNLNTAKTMVERYAAEVLKLSQDFEKKNDTVVSHVSKFTVVRDENQQCVLQNEKEPVAKLAKSFEEWQPEYTEFQKNTENFSVKAKAYNISKITNEADERISQFKKSTEQKLSQFAIKISECAKLCNGKLKFPEVKKNSDMTAEEAKSFRFDFEYAQIRKFDERVSDTIDKDYNTLCATKTNLVDGRLTTLFNQITSLTKDLESLQNHLQMRISFKDIYVFDKTADSMNEQDPRNLDRRKNLEKLQTCHAIAHGTDIEQVWYGIHSPTWILLNKASKEVKVTGIDTPYRGYKPFQEAIRKAYRGY
jgi:chromosome segregation ATPase